VQFVVDNLISYVKDPDFKTLVTDYYEKLVSQAYYVYEQAIKSDEASLEVDQVVERFISIAGAVIDARHEDLLKEIPSKMI
jgi:hypothetical protein